MIKHLITEITEEDFRKLDLKGWVLKRVEDKDGYTQFKPVQVSLNDILDDQYAGMVESESEWGFEEMCTPITVAIHENNGMSYNEISVRGGLLFVGYCDKFMDTFTGPSTFEFGIGIKHLYSSRDYYECRTDYWRVRKSETKVIYRIKADPKRIEEYKVRNVIEKSEPTNTMIDGKPATVWFEKHLFIEDDGTKTLKFVNKHVKQGQCVSILAVDNDLKKDDGTKYDA